MAMAKTSAAPVNRIPSARTNRSFSLGTMMITSAPATGSSVVIVMVDSSHPLIEPSLSLSDQIRENDRQHQHPHEQERDVPLDVAGLDVPQETAGGAVRAGDTVHRTIDHAPVEEVHHLRQTAGPCTRAVHDGVEDVLVEPVHGRGQLVANGIDDEGHVEVVDVELPLQQTPHRTERMQWVALLPGRVQPPREQDAAEGRDRPDEGDPRLEVERLRFPVEDP